MGPLERKSVMFKRIDGRSGGADWSGGGMRASRGGVEMPGGTRRVEGAWAWVGRGGSNVWCDWARWSGGLGRGRGGPVDREEDGVAGGVGSGRMRVKAGEVGEG